MPDLTEPATPAFDASVANIPSVRAERCVHSLCEQASCAACAVACPTGAWSIDDEQLSIDTTRCDGCGLCVAACPQEALELPLTSLALNVAGQRMALVACERGVAPDERGGVAPCIHALGIRALARLVAERIQAVIACTDDCGTCPRGGGRRLDEHVRHINRLLDARSQPRLKYTRISRRDWLGLRARGGAATSRSPARRRFLLDGMARLAYLGNDSEPIDPAPPRSASALLADPGTGLAEWRPNLDATQCNGCDACTRLCPTQAVVYQQHLGVYEVTPDACTGCQLCRDVCPVGAISLVPLGPAMPYRIELERRRCRACGVSFHPPAEHHGTEHECPICREVNHYRRLYQVLD